ncbi:hypothetical protein E1B28_012149 [Marasmius oreades]|uniref:Uncharacterized protein n=1 Tax=Marasmius oreades TaxID=181124 RepID=A0A9P7RQZ1_9AGAR|nr:uncharacterized protein E1B28_012149 [Marasmius oreades]KAG7088124.1 hypothetical protein E1B28_012149 [Marasmius oreades]
MDSLSWKDALSAAIGSCVPCFRPSNDSDNDSFQNPSSSSRSRPPQHLESLLAEPLDTDTEAETVSLHSNLGSGSGTPRTRRNKKKKQKKNQQPGGITLFGLNLFGRRTGAVHLPDDDEEVDRLLNRYPSRRLRRTSSSSTTPAGATTTRSSSLTFDADAAPLDAASLDQLTPAQLEERARQAELQVEEERRAKEERKRKRREKKELKKLAAQLAVSGPGDDGDFEGFQGSGSLGVGAGTGVNNGYPFIPAPLFSPDTMGSQSVEDEGDGSADLDGTLYTGRSRAGGASVSGGGSDSQRSPASGSAASYHEYQYQYQYPNEANLTPSTAPTTKKKKKSSSSKSKSSQSHSSATSSTQSPSLASPVGTEFMGLPSPSPLGDRFPRKPVSVMTDSYSVEDRGFPSPGFGGLARVGRNGAFLASKGDEA